MNEQEYFATALQIFDYCETQSTESLPVEAVMNKLEPFIKSDKLENTDLRSLLDPDNCNPEITVTKLANALNNYSKNQNMKIDLDESFNSRSGHVPQDSDSGISTDGFHLIDELQCELREKTHLASKLRSELEFTDRQNEEAMATLTAERDSLRAHLNLMREENMSLNCIRQDYLEACERLCNSDKALREIRNELDSLRRRNRVLQETVDTLENERITLQELLKKSKDESHRLNDLYASRQATLLDENESLKTNYANLNSKYQDQEEFMQQMIKEKVLLEMELKEIVNKSNFAQTKINQSIDVSLTDDQLLTALDGLNTETHFDNESLQEDSFMNSFKEDQGRLTNMSLFDEIKLSFNCTRKKEFKTCETQTDVNNNNEDGHLRKLEADLKKSQEIISVMSVDLEIYENSISSLQGIIEEENKHSRMIHDVIKAMYVKLNSLDAAIKNSSNILNYEVQSAECQTDLAYASVSTQVDKPCMTCEKQIANRSQSRNVKSFFWSTLKSLFQFFAIICFCMAVIFMYNVSHYNYAARRCLRESPAVPWRWLAVQDLLDFILHIEYVGEVPM